MILGINQKIKLGRILKKCTLVHRQIGLLQEDEQLQLWFRNSPEPVGDRDLVASLEAVDGVMVMLAKVKRSRNSEEI